MAVLKYFLIFNVGSSSIKATLFTQTFERVLDAHCKEIHSKTSRLEVHPGVQKTCRIQGDLQKAFALLIEALTPELAKGALLGIGHRFIHGGWKYKTSQKIDEATLAHLKKLKDLAPLHNPECLAIIEASRRHFPKNIPQIAIFDTAFHRTLPPAASHYAIPKQLADKHHIQRYGFHGISHAYLSEKYAQITKKKTFKLITLHLGNGCSAAAILNGKSIETSMGFSPAEGLVMGTRAGDIDFTVLEYLAKAEKKSLQQITHLLNFESGLLGISGKTADMKTLMEHSRDNPRCQLAIDLFCHRIVKYIGAYCAVLQGVDAIIFSGGIGENAPLIRKMVCAKLKWLGVKITGNNSGHLLPGEVKKLHTAKSNVEIYTIATDEDLFMAQQIRDVL